jgi:uncharacterized protein YlxW (UPF0749 family)
MKRWIGFVLLIALVLVWAVGVSAQETEATRRLDDLRNQLSSLQDKEADLKIRLEELNFDLKPENIERYFTGYGSTRPEELRESRRRQLQTEKDRIVALLDQLSASRTRLEVSITSAQADVYQQSALGAMTLQRDQDRRHLLRLAGLTGTVVLVIGIGSLALCLVIRRRRNLRDAKDSGSL